MSFLREALKFVGVTLIAHCLLLKSSGVPTKLVAIKKEPHRSLLGEKQGIVFCTALKGKLQDSGSDFGNEYLRLLMD